MSVLLLSARSAEPPHSSGSAAGEGVDHRAGGLAGGHRGAGVVRRQVVGPALGQPAGEHAVELGGAVRVLRAPVVEALLPLGVQRAAAVDDLARVCEDLGGHVEALGRVEPERLLGGRDLLGAQGGAVRLAGVLGVRGRPGDDRPDRDDAGPVGRVAGGHESLVQRLHVVDVLDALGVPAVGGVPAEHVLRQGDLGVALDRDVVVVVEQDEVAELLVAREARRLRLDALLDVAVRGEDPDRVVERRLARRGVRVEQPALPAGGHRHADRVADALTERAGGGLDPGGVAVLGVTRRAAAPLPVELEVVERQAVAGQEQLDVERQARVPAGEHEPVPPQPRRVGRVVAQQPLEEQVGGGRQAHRGAGVAGAGLLDRVHRENAHGVDGTLVELVPGQGSGFCAHRPSVPTSARRPGDGTMRGQHSRRDCSWSDVPAVARRPKGDPFRVFLPLTGRPGLLP